MWTKLTKFKQVNLVSLLTSDGGQESCDEELNEIIKSVKCSELYEAAYVNGIHPALTMLRKKDVERFLKITHLN